MALALPCGCRENHALAAPGGERAGTAQVLHFALPEINGAGALFPLAWNDAT